VQPDSRAKLQFGALLARFLMALLASHPGEWLQYDDDKVSPVEEDKVLQLSGGGMSLVGCGKGACAPLLTSRSVLLPLAPRRRLAHGVHSAVCAQGPGRVPRACAAIAAEPGSPIGVKSLAGQVPVRPREFILSEIDATFAARHAVLHGVKNYIMMH
jgi:hypothetical protein